MVKFLAVLCACLMACTSFSFASDDTLFSDVQQQVTPFDASAEVSAAGASEWITPKLNFTDTLSGVTCTIFGSMTRYKLNSSDLGLFDYSKDMTVTASSGTVTGVPNFINSGAKIRNSIKLPQNFTFPYNHYESDQKTYYELYDFPQISLKSAICVFYTDLYLDPGFYEIESDCNIGEFLLQPGHDRQYFRPEVFEVGLEAAGRSTFIYRTNSDKTRFTVEVTKPARVFFSCSASSQITPYLVSEPVSSWPVIVEWDLNLPDFKYRTIPQADVAALQAAVDDSNNSQNSYDSVESQWTGSMTDNFNALNVEAFKFNAGLINAFSFVSLLFSRFWASLGIYSVVYVFPLTLGIVLLLIGRLSKFSGGQSSATRNRGDADA